MKNGSEKKKEKGKKEKSKKEKEKKSGREELRRFGSKKKRN